MACSFSCILHSLTQWFMYSLGLVKIYWTLMDEDTLKNKDETWLVKRQRFCEKCPCGLAGWLWVSTKKGMAKWIRQWVHSSLPSWVVHMAGPGLAIKKCWLEDVCVHPQYYLICIQEEVRYHEERKKRKEPMQLITDLVNSDITARGQLDQRILDSPEGIP